MRLIVSETTYTRGVGALNSFVTASYCVKLFRLLNFYHCSSFGNDCIVLIFRSLNSCQSKNESSFSCKRIFEFLCEQTGIVSPRDKLLGVSVLPVRTLGIQIEIHSRGYCVVSL